MEQLSMQPLRRFHKPIVGLCCQPQETSQLGQIRPIWIVVWLVLINVIAGQVDFDWRQDIVVYQETLDSQSDSVLDSSKGDWYRYLVYPLRERLGNTDSTLAALRGIILSLMFISQRRSLRSHIDCLLFLTALCVTPALVENMTQYLRQGTALGLLMLGLSFSAWWLAIPLIVLSLLTHPVTLLPVGAVCVSWLASRGRTSRQWPLQLSVLLGLVGLSIVCGMYGGGLLRSLEFEQARAYLSGSRSNHLGLLYLGTFAAWTGIQYGVFRSRPHLPVFVMFLVITASYSVLLNYGRTLSIVLPLHLAAGLALPTTRARCVDLAAICCAGSVYTMAG
jgi:hypothetical protein